jgi:hypothetical protein
MVEAPETDWRTVKRSLYCTTCPLISLAPLSLSQPYPKLWLSTLRQARKAQGLGGAVDFNGIMPSPLLSEKTFALHSTMND